MSTEKWRSSLAHFAIVRVSSLDRFQALIRLVAMTAQERHSTLADLMRPTYNRLTQKCLVKGLSIVLRYDVPLGRLAWSFSVYHSTFFSLILTQYLL